MRLPQPLEIPLPGSPASYEFQITPHLRAPFGFFALLLLRVAALGGGFPLKIGSPYRAVAVPWPALCGIAVA